jgi:hypothetical protein
METTSKTRTRTRESRPEPPRAATGPAGNRFCGRCPAYPVASFRHGALVSVLIVHRCGRTAQPQPINDWLGAVDPNDLRRRHAQGQHGR